MAKRIRKIVIDKEQAVFWLDRHGRWRNAHGPFENPKIIAFFHAHIRRDAGGWHVLQRYDDCLEKVYFHCEDTALFAFDLLTPPPVTVVLNTGKKLPLMPRKLLIAGEDLYMCRGEDRIKFVDRALLKISGLIETEGRRYFIRVGGRRYRIAEAPAPPGQGP